MQVLKCLSSVMQRGILATSSVLLLLLVSYQSLSSVTTHLFSYRCVILKLVIYNSPVLIQVMLYQSLSLITCICSRTGDVLYRYILSLLMVNHLLNIWVICSYSHEKMMRLDHNSILLSVDCAQVPCSKLLLFIHSIKIISKLVKYCKS